MRTLFDGVEPEKYQTILVDEVQDYDTEWIKLVRDCFLAEGGEMVLFGESGRAVKNGDKVSVVSVLAGG